MSALTAQLDTYPRVMSGLGHGRQVGHLQEQAGSATDWTGYPGQIGLNLNAPRDVPPPLMRSITPVALQMEMRQKNSLSFERKKIGELGLEAELDALALRDVGQPALKAVKDKRGLRFSLFELYARVQYRRQRKIELQPSRNYQPVRKPTLSAVEPLRPVEAIQASYAATPSLKLVTWPPKPGF